MKTNDFILSVDLNINQSGSLWRVDLKPISCFNVFLSVFVETFLFGKLIELIKTFTEKTAFIHF